MSSTKNVSAACWSEAMQMATLGMVPFPPVPNLSKPRIQKELNEATVIW